MSSIEVEEEEEDEFLNQLKQEELERQARKETKELPKGLTYTDDDGTVMEWDHDRKAYFPKIDADFIAQYQINYGAAVQPTPDDPSAVSEEEQKRRYEEYWSSYYQAYTKEQPKMPVLDVEGNEVEEDEEDGKDGKKKEKKDKKVKDKEDAASTEGQGTEESGGQGWDPTSEEVYQYNLYYYGQEYADEYRGYYRDNPEEAVMPDWYAHNVQLREKKRQRKKIRKGRRRLRREKKGKNLLKKKVGLRLTRAPRHRSTCPTCRRISLRRSTKNSAPSVA